MKIALGSAQFGLPYGIANRAGQVDADTVANILHRARVAGIDTIDTAIAYGCSEERLGQAGVEDWRIITKLPGMPSEDTDIAAWVENQICGSVSRLRVLRVGGLLLHRPQELLSTKGDLLWSALQDLKQSGVVQKIGFSVYEPEEIALLWDRYQPDLVQAPYNLLDRRLGNSGWLHKMTDAGVEVHVRSVFLQGLLLMKPSERPEKFMRWRSLWHAYDAWLRDRNVSSLQASLAFVLNNPSISKVIIGVDSLVQLEEILSATHADLDNFPDDFSSTDQDLLNPARWSML